MAAVPPPTLLRLALGASLALTVLPVGFGVQYVRTWRAERAGLTMEEQRASLHGVTWFKPGYTRLVRRLERTLPEDARILVEPMSAAIEPEDLTGERRWFLFLDYDLYPREVLVRAPRLASGTLVDYPRWLEHHVRGEDALEEELDLADRRVEWRLRYPLVAGLEPRDVELAKLIDGDWVAWELAPLRGPVGGRPSE